MRILHLDAGKAMGGGQWQALRLLRGLRDRGHACVLLARPRSPLCQRGRAEGFETHSLSAAAVWSCSAAVDLVHAHDARSHTLALAARAPLIVSRRVAYPIATNWLSRMKYRRADLYLAVSGAAADTLRQAGVEEQRIVVAPDGVPLLGRSRGQAVLAPAGKLPPFPLPVPIERSDNLERDLPNAGILTYYSEREGLGSGLLLAMSAGLAVLASDLPALREVIDDGVNGILVANHQAAWEQAIQLLASHENLRRRLGDAAQETVRERFGEGVMVEATLRAYERLGA